MHDTSAFSLSIPTSTSMAFSLPIPINDFLIEILLHLPVQSLYTCRSVCKFWRELIDSPYLRNLHNHHHQTEQDDTVYLQLDHKLSLNLLDLHSNKFLTSYDNNLFLDPRLANYIASVAGPSKGLICINYKSHHNTVPLAVCNPFLRLAKVFPITFSQIPGHLGIFYRVAAIGFDEGCYKVVQLLRCVNHRQFHVRLYSRATDSWNELAGESIGLDHNLCIRGSIKSLSGNGYFAHWRAVRMTGEGLVIVSFDMKKEVFQTVVVPDCVTRVPVRRVKMFAKSDDDACSFLLFVLDTETVEVYESRSCRGSGEVSWDLVMNVDDVGTFCGRLPKLESMWRSGCVVLKSLCGRKELVFYDYRVRKFIGYCEFDSSSRSNWLYRLKNFQYQGSFISP